jgi:hypothetical protein
VDVIRHHDEGRHVLDAPTLGQSFACRVSLAAKPGMDDVVVPQLAKPRDAFRGAERHVVIPDGVRVARQAGAFDPITTTEQHERRRGVRPL